MDKTDDVLHLGPWGEGAARSARWEALLKHACAMYTGRAGVPRGRHGSVSWGTALANNTSRPTAGGVKTITLCCWELTEQLLLAGWLNAPATRQCISGTHLLHCAGCHTEIEPAEKNLSSHPVSLLTPGQPEPVQTLYDQAPGRVATGVPKSMSLVWPNLEKDPRPKRELNPGMLLSRQIPNNLANEA